MLREALRKITNARPYNNKENNKENSKPQATTNAPPPPASLPACLPPQPLPVRQPRAECKCSWCSVCCRTKQLWHLVRFLVRFLLQQGQGWVLLRW